MVVASATMVKGSRLRHLQGAVWPRRGARGRISCRPSCHADLSASPNCRMAAKAAPCRHEIAGRSEEISTQRREAAAPVEPYFDRTPQPFGDGLPDPLVYDASPRMLRQRTVNFAAKRLVDMRYVSGLDRATAERHFRWRPAVPPGGLGFRAAPDGQAELAAAQRRGDIVVDMDDADRRVTVGWSDTGFGEPVVGAAVARPGYGGIVLGPHPRLRFDPQPVPRRQPEPGRSALL